MDREKLKIEAEKLEGILKGKSIEKIFRNRADEVVIEFKNGTRFFIEVDEDVLEFSIT